MVQQTHGAANMTKINEPSIKKEEQDVFCGQVVQLDRGYPLVELGGCVPESWQLENSKFKNCQLKDNQSVNCPPENKHDKQYSNISENTRIRCEYSTNMKHDACAVGDYVSVRVPHSHDNGVILNVEPRTRELVRKDPSEQSVSQVLAVNFDSVFILQPVLDVNLSRLQRELVVAHQTGARVMILLTKVDLVLNSKLDEEEARAQVNVTLNQAREIAGANVDVLPVSIHDVESVNRVRSNVASGQLAVMIGRSGVGKSSLINALAGANTRQTANVRAYDGKGRHTTVNRTIVDIPDGGRVVDMPGVRGLGVWEAQEGLNVVFPDIVELSNECKFRDCTHTGEPGCSVIEAVERGELSRVRLNVYRDLLSEINTQRQRREASMRSSGYKKSDKSNKFRRDRRK